MHLFISHTEPLPMIVACLCPLPSHGPSPLCNWTKVVSSHVLYRLPPVCQNLTSLRAFIAQHKRVDIVPSQTLHPAFGNQKQTPHHTRRDNEHFHTVPSLGLPCRHFMSHVHNSFPHLNHHPSGLERQQPQLQFNNLLIQPGQL